MGSNPTGSADKIDWKRGLMERVWEELKRIERTAENLRLESFKKAENIVKIARGRSGKIVKEMLR